MTEALMLALWLAAPKPSTQWAVSAVQVAAIAAVVQQPQVRRVRIEYGLSPLAEKVAKDLWMTRRISFGDLPEKLSGAKIGVTITF